MPIDLMNLAREFSQYGRQQSAELDAKKRAWFNAQESAGREKDRAAYLAQLAQQNQTNPGEAFRQRLEAERAQRDFQDRAYHDVALKNQLGQDLTNEDRASLGLPQQAPSTAAPLANYLAGAEDQGSYKTAMLQYRAAGGKVPKWYTGDFDQDQENIQTAIKATMTPQQQLIRQDAEQRLQDLQEARKARIQLQQESLDERKKQHALSRENAAPVNVVPTKNEQQITSDALETSLTPELFQQLPSDQAKAAINEISSKAKALMKSPEGKGLSYDEIIQQEVDKAIASGKLKPGQEGTGLRGFLGIGQAAEKPSFGKTQKPSETKSTTVPPPGTILKGYKFLGGDPSNPKSWEKQ